MGEWTQGETYAVIGIPLILVGGWAISAVVGRFRPRWGDQIALFAVICLIVWIGMSAMRWSEPWSGQAESSPDHPCSTEAPTP